MLTAMEMLASFNRDKEASAKRLETIVDDTPMDDHTPESPMKEGTDETAKTIEGAGTRHVNVSVNIDTKNKEEEILKNIADNHGTLRVATLHNYITRSNIHITPELIASQEGFVDNVFNSILNKISGLMYLFKTALFDGWRDFKRTELKVFHDNHLASLRSIYKIKPGILDHITFEHPCGMQGDYITALNTLENVFNALNMSDTASKIVEVIEKLQSQVYIGNGTFSAVLDTEGRNFAKLEKEINKAFDKASEVFTEKKNDKAKLKDLYGTPADIETVVDKLIDMETHFQAVAGIYSKLEKIQDKVTDLNESVKRNEISAKEINMLYDLIRVWGFMFEKFSLNVNDLYRVNHNVYVNLLVIDDYQRKNL